jgi:hypothetical protein
MKLADSWADIAEGETEVTSPPMELPEILEGVRGLLCRYIVFSSKAQEIVVALWVAHTSVIEAFDYTPYLHISSPAKRCGKSRVFDCLKLLTRFASPAERRKKSAPTIAPHSLVILHIEQLHLQVPALRSRSASKRTAPQ